MIYLSKNWLFGTEKNNQPKTKPQLNHRKQLCQQVPVTPPCKRRTLTWKAAQGLTASSSLQETLTTAWQKHFCWERQHHRPVLKPFQWSYQAISYIIPSLHAGFSFSRVLVQAQLAICCLYSHFWSCRWPNLDFSFHITENISTLALHICSLVYFTLKKNPQ